jgi:small subunit ribosomal protein S12
MVTLNQLVKNNRKKRQTKYSKIALKDSPQRKGVCLKVTTTNPKKTKFGCSKNMQSSVK